MAAYPGSRNALYLRNAVVRSLIPPKGATVHSEAQITYATLAVLVCLAFALGIMLTLGILWCVRRHKKKNGGK